MTINKTLLFGAILGLSSVLMAAYADHALASKISSESLHSMSVAIRYHQLYALMIVGLGLIIPLQLNQQIKEWLMKSACVFIIGTLLFSFSIYISVLTGFTSLLHLTPIGGIVLMLGWCSLMYAAVLKRS